MMERLHNNRQVLILFIAMLFLALLAAYMLLMRPDAQQIKSNDDQISNLQQETGLYLRKINEWKAQEDTNLSDEEIEKKLPNAPNKEQIILDLHQIGDDTGIRLVDVSFTEAAEGRDSSAEPKLVENQYVTANIQGSYMAIKLWMGELQKLPRLTAIDQISLQKPYINSGSTLITATVTFTAAYLPKDLEGDGTSAEATSAP